MRVISGQRKVDVLHPPRSQAHALAAQAYELYVHDERYTVPTLHLLNTASEKEARRIAEACLAETPHHQRVELWLGKSRIAAWGGEGSASPPRSAPRG